MRDPFPLPRIPALSKATEPLAELLSFPTLPLHVHEVVAAALFYTFIQVAVSPILSRWLAPAYYPTSRAKKINWDAHVVSLIQSTLINALSLWVILVDEERGSSTFEERIWGYTGASGMIQALACGYFVWDLAVTLLYLDVFGLGLLAHAVSALAVYSFGFRPFLNYYSCIFILYELSTPFLNIHWFFDKLNMTGSRAQLYNGIALLFTFFSCRLVWGTYQSALVYADMWRAVQTSPDAGYVAAALSGANSTLADPDHNMMAFVTEAVPVPKWLALLYVASNITLNSLNWVWFFKMIAAVRKRFEPPKGEKAAVVDGEPAAALTSGAEKGAGAAVSLRRRGSIADVIPDSEELRKGQIQ